MGIGRWWHEFTTPGAKCERLGHKLIDWEGSVYLYPTAETIFRYHYVADDATETRHICARCQHETEATISNRRGLNGLSLPTSWWDELKETGIKRSGNVRRVFKDPTSNEG